MSQGEQLAVWAAAVTAIVTALVGILGQVAKRLDPEVIEKIRAARRGEQEAYIARLSDDIDKLRARLEALETRNDELVLENASLKAKVAILENERDALKLRVSGLETHVAQLERQA